MTTLLTPISPGRITASESVYRSPLSVMPEHFPKGTRLTVDPRRDTPRVLRAWLNNYNRSFIGLTGSEQAIRRAALDSGIPLPPPSKQSSDGVVHSSFVFPYSPDGHAHVVYTQGFSALDYAHDMALLASF